MTHVHQSPTDNALAERMAVEYIRGFICTCARHSLQRAVAEAVVSDLSEKRTPARQDVLRNTYINLVKNERKFKKMITAIWKEEEAIIIANLKKMKKAWLRKDEESDDFDAVDSILYVISMFVKKIASGATQAYIDIMTTEGKRTAEIYDFDMDFDVHSPEIERFLKSYTPMFSKELEWVSVEKLRAELIEGMRAGEGIPELVKRVNKTYRNWNKYRSINIARSEAIRASNAAARETYRQSGVVKKLVWMANLDDRCCDFCADLDGKIVGIDDNFFDYGDTYEVTGRDGEKMSMNIDYTDVGHPPLHSQCVLPGTECKAPGGFVAGLRSRYSGPAVELMFSDGGRLAVTGNHLLLTPNGFAPAHLLREGDDIFYCPDFDRIEGPNNNGKPTLAEKIIESLAEIPGMVSISVPASPEDLHGDGRFCNGDIDVIFSRGLLGDTGKAAFDKSIENKSLVFPAPIFFNLAANGDLASEFIRAARASDGAMGGLRQAHPFFARRAAHADIHGLTSAPGNNAAFNKAETDNVSGNAELFGKGFFRDAGLIKTKKVTSVNVFSYHGFTYDYQTSTSLYLAESIISSNCRCALGPWIED
jgi:SPP1 gp7 family putative phage head morphogenesis protein